LSLDVKIVEKLSKNGFLKEAMYLLALIVKGKKWRKFSHRWG